MGCGTCVAVCLAGGEKEVAVLNAEIDMARKLDNNPLNLVPKPSRDSVTVNIWRSWMILSETTMRFMSMACGVGIQFLAERFPDIPVFPACGYHRYVRQSGGGMV